MADIESIGLGVVADDITGACDVAVEVDRAGVSAEVRLGVPDADTPASSGCVIAALKSRTVDPGLAVADSVAAARALRALGAETLYQKYCSTFDSTDAGNIGPVADALMDLVAPGAISVGTPATPAVARTVHRGHLFVGDRLLSESSLAHHPLTPMCDPDLVRVLGRQTPRPVASVGIDVVRSGSRAIAEELARLRAGGVRHVLLDAEVEDDLDAAAAALDEVAFPVLLGGAAGLATAVARRWGRARDADRPPPPDGRGLVLSGSGSERTREQVAAHRGPRVDLPVERLVEDPDAVVAHAVAFVAAESASGIPLVSATADPAEVARVQERWGRERTADLVEGALARIAREAVERLGIRRLLVAGGETSGAVTAELGIRALRVRRPLGPGLAWMTALDRDGRTLDVCPKSGNFGSPDLFAAAWTDPPSSD